MACVCTRDDGKGDKPGDGGGDELTVTAKGFVLTRDKAQADLVELTRAPHPLGSPRQVEVTAYLETRVQESGSTPKREAFTVDVPNPAALDSTGPVATTLSRTGANLWALDNVVTGAPCVVAIASHYDTKDIPGLNYVGANDSGSSSVTLLHQIGYLRSLAAKAETLGLVCDVVGVWFDGEEALLANWGDGQTQHPAQIQDNTYGSRHSVSRLTDCPYEGKTAKCLPSDLGGKPLVALVLMDMIGSPELRISRDSNSSPTLITMAASAAKAVGAPRAYDDRAKSVEDDHIPFRKVGVPAVDLIDFNNLDYWHRPGDEAANVSLDSMEIAGRIALHVALSAAKAPAGL